MPIIDTQLEKYLVEILNQSDSGIIVTDPTQEKNPVIYVNDTICKTFGYERKEFLGKNCGFLQSSDKEQKQLELINKAIRDKVSTTVTLRNYSKSGELIYNQITISPIFDEYNNLKYFLGVQRDITKEVLLHHQNEQLQEERIDNAQYSAIGKLCAGLSHEINTPLTIIKGNMEMLKSSIESLENNSDKEYMLSDLSSIANNLNRIKNITESMREIADTEQFNMNEINIYRAVVISLRLIYNKAKRITKININDKEFDLDLDREFKKFMVKGDYKKLEQAFISIIDNALDQLEINGSFEENLLDIKIFKQDNKVNIVFTDNGGGVDPEILSEIFKPFKSNKTHRGLGIGLSVVKKIMDEHGFDITLENSIAGVKVTILT